jgi:hypothetical protein
MSRQKSQTLPTGQIVTHTYSLGAAPGASWHKVTTGIAPNIRWTHTLFDGFGRPLEVTTGYQVNSTETAVTKVRTEYPPCACSSIGKVLRVSMPYATNASPPARARCRSDIPKPSAFPDQSPSNTERPKLGNPRTWLASRPVGHRATESRNRAEQAPSGKRPETRPSRLRPEQDTSSPRSAPLLPHTPATPAPAAEPASQTE